MTENRSIFPDDSSALKHRIALVGCGRWGRNILRDLLSLGCQVEVVDPSMEARETARAMGAAKTHETVERIDGEGVVVATPATTHAKVVEELVSLGIPLFVEKPLTTDADAAHRLLRIAAGRIFVMNKWRYHPAIERLREIGSSGTLGTVSGLRTVRIQSSETQTDTDAIWTLAPHDLSIALEILGHIPRPRSAVKEGGSTGSGAGMIAILGDSPWMTLEVSSLRPVRERSVTLIGTDGSAYFNDGSNSIRVMARDKEIIEEPVELEPPPLLRQLAAFLAYLSGGPPPKGTIEDGVAVVETITRLRDLAGMK